MYPILTELNKKKDLVENLNYKYLNYKYLSNIYFCKNLNIYLTLSKYSRQRIDLILGDLLQSVFSVVSAPDNIVQSKLVSLKNIAGF